MRRLTLSTTPPLENQQPEYDLPLLKTPLSAVAAEKRATTRSNIVFAIAILLLLALAWKLLKELEILYVSALFAVVLMPVAQRIMAIRIGKWSPSRPVAILLMFLIVVGGLALFFFIGLPPVMRDLDGFVHELPRRIPLAAAKFKQLPFVDRLNIDETTAKAENFAGAFGAYIVNALPMWLSHFLDIITALFLCIYFMLEGEYVYSFFLSLFPAPEARRLDVTLRKAELKMSKWLIGQGLLMLCIGVCSTIAFGLLHVRYFLLLGFLMGLLNIIPIAGAVVTVLLAAIVAAFDSWSKMAGVFIFYGIYINIENGFLTPRIMRSSVNLEGITVLIALLLGTSLAGIVGALVAVPTAALIAVLLEEYAVKNDPRALVT